MSKITLKSLIKKIRQNIKITGLEDHWIEKKQFNQSMDDVITFLKSTPIDESHAKVCSSFLSRTMHLFKSIAQNKENKIIEDDDEENYQEKFSTILSYFIDSELKRLRLNFKDTTKTNPEKLFVDNLIVKCRIYNANAGDMMIVRALGKFLARIDFKLVFDDAMMKLTFNRLFKKILLLRTSADIKQNDLFYYQQLLHTWLKISDDLKQKERILNVASDLNIDIETIENGRIHQQILGLELFPGINYALDNKSVDLFDNLKEDFAIKNIQWLKKLQKTPFSAEATVDLTMDTDDSDIEVELPVPVELIEVDDNEQVLDESMHEIPLMMSTPILEAEEMTVTRSAAISQTPRIGIQERRYYIQPLNDNVKPLSFIALRRQSILDDEKRKATPLNKRRKSAHGRLFEEDLKKKDRTKATDAPGALRKTRSKSVNYTNKFKSIADPKKLSKIAKAMPKCSVQICKISNREIAQLRKGKLPLEYFESKFEVNNVTKQAKGQNSKRKLIKDDPKTEPSPKKRKITKVNVKKEPKQRKEIKAKIKKEPKKRKVTKKSPKKSEIYNNNNSSYPDHTQPNISLLQVIVDDLSLQPTSSTHKNETIKDISFETTQHSSKSEDDPSIPIVNWPREQVYSPLIDSIPNIDSLDIVNNTSSLILNRTESFDAISDNDQNGSIDTSINKTLLEDILGDRANNYLPEVHASILSTLSRSSQSADERSPSPSIINTTEKATNSKAGKSCERRKSERRKSKKEK